MKLIAKFGTNAIFDSKKEKIRNFVLEQIAKDAFLFLEQGNELIIVSSGSVGYGKKILKGQDGVGLKQAQAAIGQTKLMHEYEKSFAKNNLHTAQFLLTYNDLDSITRINNIKHTYKHLKNNKIIPIVNENDTTAVEELCLGDNDKLSLQLLFQLNFDTLINYTKIGPLLKDNQIVSRTNIYDSNQFDLLGSNQNGFGGLTSKLNAAKKATLNKKKYIIAKAGDSLSDILENKAKNTRFYI